MTNQILTANVHNPHVRPKADRHKDGGLTVTLGKDYNAHVCLFFKDLDALKAFAWDVVSAGVEAEDIAS